ncbi:Flp family type IVb pilin [Marinobacter halodurans]|uniref:Flp family type IVb pilin n=1 Tax=Marinobacter halodurans TaxID=2528979 RepID=A0ABY1ZKC5_9GAMM|nr:Flp family type IVb pilin [Marinobacter halodurans]TBW54347.1 Flp family type IVb pilin [Marinobacter halodurans]
MKNFTAKVSQFLRDEEGLELSEYAVAGSLIVLGAVAAFTTLGGDIATAIGKISAVITGTP